MICYVKHRHKWNCRRKKSGTHIWESGIQGQEPGIHQKQGSSAPSKRLGEITISSKTLLILKNHTMTYNIILLLFTISSILKCQFLNHTQSLYKITISSICLALLRYIIHVLVLAPAIFIFHSTCHTGWCTTPPNEGEASHCHVVFHHCCSSSVVAPALCH
jgi:hypothetical protein